MVVIFDRSETSGDELEYIVCLLHERIHLYVFMFITLLIWFSLAGPYVAPEIYKDEIFDRNADIYSFGILLYEVWFLFVWYFN